MPVSFGYRDEENERINNILKKLMSLVTVPGSWDEPAFDSELKRLTLRRQDLLAISSDELILYLIRYHFDFENMEAFADILAKFGQNPGMHHMEEKALTIYNYIQKESNMFSFGINNKIQWLKPE